MRKITTLLALLLIVVTQGAFAQRAISGRVISSEDGLAMPGVTVMVRGTTIGTATDVNGNFSLNVPNDAVILVSFMGFRTVEQTVGNQTQFNITLDPDVLTLGDVVVTALGISRETRTLTYSAQQVSGEEMLKAQDINFMNALSGRAAGLDIRQAASGAGGSTRTVLRGARSFTGTGAPLYVVDGVPIRNTVSGGGSLWGGFDDGDGISQINPDDIESISVLKGANAAMLYGSAGANGVILITTKKGTAGTMSISISNATSFENVMIWPELQYRYGTQRGEKESWAPTPHNNPNGFSEKDLKDWFQTGNNIATNIAISGGAGSTTAYFSYGRTTSKGIIPSNTYRRDNVSFRQSTKIFNNKVTISSNVMFTDDYRFNPPPSGWYYNTLTGLYWFPRERDINEYKNEYKTWDNNRNLYTMNWHVQDHHQSNPWWLTNMNERENSGQRLIGSANITWDITSNLNLRVTGSIDYSNSHSEFRQWGGGNTTNVHPNGTWSYNQGTNKQQYSDAVLTYDNNFGDISLNALVGVSYRENGGGRSVSGSNSATNGLNLPNVFRLANLPHQSTVTNSTQNVTITEGYFANTTIGFRDMVYLDLSGRVDRSSTMAMTDYGVNYFYPAAGISGIISQMVQLPSFITFGKARASYTVVANDVGFDNIMQWPTLSGRSITASGSSITTSPSIGIPSAPDWLSAKPEKVASLEIGTDWRFLEGRVGLDFTYYNTVSTDQRVSVQTLQGMGFASRLMNVGRIDNTGIEIMVDAEPVSAGGFSWNTSLNYAHNRNKVIEVDPDQPNREISLGSSNSYYSIIKAGGSVGDLYTFGFLYDDQGRMMVDQDYRALKTSVHEYIGSGNPDFTLGWNNTLKYQRFTLGFLVNGVFGGKVMSYTETMLDGAGVSKRSAEARDRGFDPAINFVDDNGNPISAGWVDVNAVVNAPGESNHGEVVKRIDSEVYYKSVGTINGVFANYAYDRTNIRLTQFSLSYDIPVRQLNLPLRSASIALTGQNLFFIYKPAPYDPELTMSAGTGSQNLDNFNLPATRRLGFNIRVNF